MLRIKLAVTFFQVIFSLLPRNVSFFSRSINYILVDFSLTQAFPSNLFGLWSNFVFITTKR